MIHLVGRDDEIREAEIDEGSLIGSVLTGVPGLDTVLRGGLPELSFNLIAGGPGAGKTTLAQQVVFSNATVERPALYFTVLGEPTLKMLRYQRQFRRSSIGSSRKSSASARRSWSSTPVAPSGSTHQGGQATRWAWSNSCNGSRSS
jgi:replicative DNA helicase